MSKKPAQKDQKVRCKYCDFFISFWYDDRKVDQGGTKVENGNFVYCWHFGYTAMKPESEEPCRFYMPRKFPSVKEWAKYRRRQ
jgi:hypothetical protein